MHSNDTGQYYVSYQTLERLLTKKIAWGIGKTYNFSVSLILGHMDIPSKQELLSSHTPCFTCRIDSTPQCRNVTQALSNVSNEIYYHFNIFFFL